MKAKSQKVKKMKVHHVSNVLCMYREHTMLAKCAKEKKKNRKKPCHELMSITPSLLYGQTGLV